MYFFGGLGLFSISDNLVVALLSQMFQCLTSPDRVVSDIALDQLRQTVIHRSNIINPSIDIYCVFICINYDVKNLKNAFGSVLHATLFEMMSRLSISTSFIDLCRDIYHSTSSNIRTPLGLSATIPLMESSRVVLLAHFCLTSQFKVYTWVLIRSILVTGIF